MKVVLVAALVALAAGSVVQDDFFKITKDRSLVDLDIKMKERFFIKLFNHILQPTVYTDIRDVAREFDLEENKDKFIKYDIVKDFLRHFKLGMLPRGEVFVHTNEKHLRQAIRVFRLLMTAKDFDIFVRTCCWLRDRINSGMFVYVVTAAVFHRTDCHGVTLPAPYEILPHLFVDGHVIHKAQMMKMTRTITDPFLMNYYGIRITDKNCVIVDWRKGVRTALTLSDRINYFKEDIDLNTYMFYLHMSYPYWLKDDMVATSIKKERRGDVTMYAYKQLLARMRLERLSHGMCHVKPLKLDDRIKSGYWPKLRLYNGIDMPMRSNDVKVVTDENMHKKRLIDDIERVIRDGILTGRIMLRDGTELSLRKPEDIENLARIIIGELGIIRDDAKYFNLVKLFNRVLTYNQYNHDKETYIPTALDMYSTCLRDPVFWKIMKRVVDHVDLFKKTLPRYTRDELDFPGVRVERIDTDKLITFMDEYDVDITNALYLDHTEFTKRRSDMVYVARMRRLNHQPFKVTVDVVSDKTVDAVVRVFLGPKYDCMGRLLDINDKRYDMVEIDSFLHKLDTGKNTIVRDCREMHGVIDDRTWTRRSWDRDMSTNSMTTDERTVDTAWWKLRVGFPRRLLLPLGRRGGLPLQLYVVVTPVRTGLVLPTVDLNVMKERRACRWSVCFDTMPLGFPFDRRIDETEFMTKNMKFTDVFVYRKDMDLANVSKDVDISDLVMRRDDLTYLDNDMLVHRSYKDVMLAGRDNMTRM